MIIKYDRYLKHKPKIFMKKEHLQRINSHYPSSVLLSLWYRYRILMVSGIP